MPLTDGDLYAIHSAATRHAAKGERMPIRTQAAIEIAGEEIIVGEDRTQYDQIPADVKHTHTSAVDPHAILAALAPQTEPAV